MKLFIALFLAAVTQVAAQSPEVPHKMQFADLTLTIRDDARREIQKDVDAFTRYPKSFNIKADRARMYFPIIEKIFAEENVPDDMKYLAIQESALIPDAVSTSNAVGFWQFKDFTAIEMGLRVDKQIDERMNIVSSSRAAARYLKKNNTFFDNWLFALQAYQMGAGGVMRSEKQTKGGSKHIEITSSTYWYVKKYLAHRIAYESAVKGTGEMQVVTYQTKSKKSLKDIADEVKVSEEDLKEYNKWIRSGNTIPDDRMYVVAIPVKGNPSSVKIPEGAIANANTGLRETASKSAAKNVHADRIKINGITAIRAVENETPTKLAVRGAIEISAFLKYNDMSISDRVYPGKYYLLGKKRTRATEAYHKVTEGESLWSISQKYGVQMKKLKRYNRIRNDDEVKPGTTLWLASLKPKDSGKSQPSERIIEVDNETFAWEVEPGSAQVPVVETKPEKIVETVTETPKPAEDSIPSDTLKFQVPKADTLRVTTVPEPGLVITDSVPATREKIEVKAKPDQHIVKQGETLYAIAKQYNLGVMDLVAYNNLDLQQGIKPGQVLKLIENQEVAKTVETTVEGDIEHIVKPTDTVYSIARKYGVTIRELMEWNNKKDFTLSVGEKLRIVKK